MFSGLLGFLLASLIVAAGPLFAEPGGAPTWAAGAAYVLLFHFGQRRLVSVSSRRLAAGRSPTRQPRVLAWQLLGFAACLSLGHRRFVDETLALAPIWIVEESLLVLPWVLVHASWLDCRRRIDALMSRQTAPKSGPYLAFHLRLLVLPATLTLLTVLTNRIVRPGTEAALLQEAYPSLWVLGQVVITGLLAVASPVLLRAALRSRPLPAGDLRSALESLGARVGFRCLDIRVIDTGFSVLNAAFVGVVGRLRYVFITDALLRRLPPDDLLGVYAHEMGHSMRRHIPTNLALAAGLMLGLQALSGLVDATATESLVWTASLAALLALPLFIVLVFAPVARAFETEADVYASRVLGEPGPIVRSLSTLGAMMPDRIHRGGLTHPSIDQRVRYLLRHFTDPMEPARFESRMRRLRAAVALFVLIPLGAVLIALPGEIATGSVSLEVERAVRAESWERAEAAWQRLNDELVGGFEDPGQKLRQRLWTTLATIAQDRGDFDAADPWIERMVQGRDELGNEVLRYNVAIVAAQQAAARGNWTILNRELGRARPELEKVAKRLGEDEPQVRRERRDGAWLVRGLALLARAGVFGDRDAVSEPAEIALEDESPYRELMQLEAWQDAGVSSPPPELDAAALDALEHAWKAAFLRHLHSDLAAARRR